MSIPRSYYGVLTRDMLVKGLQNSDEQTEHPKGLLSLECASVVYDICVSERLLNDDSSLVLDITEEELKKIIGWRIPASHQQEYSCNREEIFKIILRSRYDNLYNLLRVSQRVLEFAHYAILLISIIDFACTTHRIISRKSHMYQL